MMASDLLSGDVMPYDFAIDMLLSNPASDQLSVLRTEVKDQNPFVRRA